MRFIATERALLIDPSTKEGDFKGAKLGGIASLKRFLPTICCDGTTNLWSVPWTVPVLSYISSKWGNVLAHDMKRDPALNKKAKILLTYLKRIKEIQADTEYKTPINTKNFPKIDYIVTPYPHQIQAMAFSLYLPKAALWLDMGLGKTYTSLMVSKMRHASEKYGGVNKVLVVVPKSLIVQWEKEIERFVPGAHILALDDSTWKSKVKNIVQLPKNTNNLTYVITTYESLTNAYIYSALNEYKFDMFILDECTRIKNPTAKRSRAAQKMCKNIPFGLELTGMAYVNSALDLYGQFLVIDMSLFGKNKSNFQHIFMQDTGFTWTTNQRMIGKLKERAGTVAFSRTKDECLDLPTKIYSQVYVQMTPAQEKWYEDLREQVHKATIKRCLEENGIDFDENNYDSMENLDTSGVVTVEFMIAFLEKATQITSGFLKDDEGNYIWFGSEKYNAVMDILTDDPSVHIIWTKHVYARDILLAEMRKNPECKNLNIRVLDNTVQGENRVQLKKDFKEGKIDVLVASLGSECEGNDLTSVRPVNAIFLEGTASLGMRAQAEDRQHRIGMTGSTTYIDIICPFTYDERLYRIIRSKRNVAEYIRDNKDAGAVSLLDDLLGGLKK